MNDITRRDFVNGTLLAAGGAMLPFGQGALAAMAALGPEYYPPSRTGLRGSQPGSNEVAHARAWNGQSDWGPNTRIEESYDCVVVGGGLSGLAAGYFYQQQHGHDKRVLILDNHDDFGGHARRNEHSVNGRLLIGEGGSESLESPQDFGDVVSRLMAELGVDQRRLEQAYDVGFYARQGLHAATYFNQRVFGQDKVVLHPFCDYLGYCEGLLRPTLSDQQAVQQTPLSTRGKQQLLRVLQGGQHVLNVPKKDLREYVRTHSYLDYLQNTLGVDDPLVLRMARHTAIDYTGYGTDLMTISEALASGCMGSDPYDAWPDALEPGEYIEYVNKAGGTYSARYPFVHHYPDGNATIARSLVKKMIPAVGAGDSAEEVVVSRFDYSQLDQPGNPVRLRLNSTVVKVQHAGDPHHSDHVYVSYVNGNRSYRVQCRGVVMAGYNMMIPHLVEDLPPEQDRALRALSKVPLQYTTVGLTNWRAMKELGVGMAMCPGNIHQVVGLDYPVSMGGYEYPRSPDDPCILHLRCVPTVETMGGPPVDQFRAARQKMLTMRFEDYEVEIREHLGGMLPRELFDFDRDVKSISINRWAHAYGYGDPGPVGRQPFGRITIANHDSVGSALMQVAVEQAWRAVRELG
jgi:spermidine dehydrogenase